MRIAYAVIFVLLLIGAPAHAANTLTDCEGNTISSPPDPIPVAKSIAPVTETNRSIRRLQGPICWIADTTETFVVDVLDDDVLISFDSDIDSTSTATATLDIEMCLAGDPVGPTVLGEDENVCLSVLDALLNGTEGGPATQKAHSSPLWPGRYRLVFTAAGGGVRSVIRVLPGGN